MANFKEGDALIITTNQFDYTTDWKCGARIIVRDFTSAEKYLRGSDRIPVISNGSNGIISSSNVRKEKKRDTIALLQERLDAMNRVSDGDETEINELKTELKAVKDIATDLLSQLIDVAYAAKNADALQGPDHKDLGISTINLIERAQKIVALPIPDGAYWSSEGGNFYSTWSHEGMGTEFYRKWIWRRTEFPQGATE